MLACSEGDRLSGLVVDVIGKTAVVSASAAWVAFRQELLTPALLEAAGLSKVYWRPNEAMLALEGLGGAPAGIDPEQDDADVGVDADADANSVAGARADAGGDVDADAQVDAESGGDNHHGDVGGIVEAGAVSQNGSEVR